MTLSQKLVKRLNTEFCLNIDGKIERLYPGSNQRSAGAWSWFIPMMGRDIGSQFPVKECLKAKVLTMCNDGSIIPD